MKKFIVLMMATALMCSCLIANATEFKASGQFDLTAENITGDRETAGVDVVERFRTQIDIVASENVSGVVYFEIGDMKWGQNGEDNKKSGAALGTDGVNIETRRAFVKFVVPHTALTVSAGLQGLTLPNAVAFNPVFDDDVASLVASYAFNNNFAATAFFARPSHGKDTVAKDHNDLGVAVSNLDIFGIIGSADFGKVSVQPYAAIANGKVANEKARFFWLGSAIKANPFANLNLGADVIYSNCKLDQPTKDIDANGFFLAGFASYDLEVVTPKLTAWWAEGKDNATDYGFYGYAGWFGPTTFGFDANTGRSTGDEFSATGRGTTGIALSLEDISLIESVTHKVVLAYYESTDDKVDDNAVEVNFITEYQMYEALTATLELSYIAADLDAKDADEDLFKTAVSLKYAF